MGNTFLFFHSTEHIEKFKRYLNKQHKNIAFTSEMEQINREYKKFVTSVYQKPTFNGVFTNFESFISKCYKRSLFDTFI